MERTSDANFPKNQPLQMASPQVILGPDLVKENFHPTSVKAMIRSKEKDLVGVRAELSNYRVLAVCRGLGQYGRGESFKAS